MTVDKLWPSSLSWHRMMLKHARCPTTEQMLPVPAQLSRTWQAEVFDR
jgi:hypothetical protein